MLFPLSCSDSVVCLLCRSNLDDLIAYEMWSGIKAMVIVCSIVLVIRTIWEFAWVQPHAKRNDPEPAATTPGTTGIRPDDDPPTTPTSDI
jgi:hypothetical protein